MVLSGGTTEKIPSDTIRLVAQRLDHYANPGLGRRNIHVPFAMTSDVPGYKTAKNAFGISVSTFLCCLVTAEAL